MMIIDLIIGAVAQVYHQIMRIYDDEVKIIMMQINDMERITRIDIDRVQKIFTCQVLVNYKNCKIC